MHADLRAEAREQLAHTAYRLVRGAREPLVITAIRAPAPPAKLGQELVQQIDRLVGGPAADQEQRRSSEQAAWT